MKTTLVIFTMLLISVVVVSDSFADKGSSIPVKIQKNPGSSSGDTIKR